MRLATPMLAVALAAIAAPAIARPDEGAESNIRSELPFWTNGNEMFPLPVAGPEGVGCEWPIETGYWRGQVPVEDDDPQDTWIYLRNEGVIHCAFHLGVGLGNRDAAQRTRPATLIPLGPTSYRGQVGHLYVWQILDNGAAYNAVFAPLQTGLVRRYQLLDMHCLEDVENAGYVLRHASVSIFSVSYCLVADRSSLSRLAQEALRRPPVAEFVWQSVDDASTSDAER